MAGLKHKGWTPETIHRRVNAVMDRAIHQLDHPSEPPAFETFGDFYTALLKANDNISSDESVRRINRYFQADIESGKRKKSTLSSAYGYQKNQVNPTYEFIGDVIASNALMLDPKRIGKGGDQRAAMFAMAGLTEVTADAIVHHYNAVFDRAKKALDAGESLRWAEVMKDLFEIHVQGELSSYTRIEDDLHQLEPTVFDVKYRLNGILQVSTQPTDAERTSMYGYLDITPEQIEWMEKELAEGGRFVKHKLHQPKDTLFSRALNEILTTLNDNGVSQGAIERESTPRIGTRPAIRGNELGQWRRGEFVPSLPKLRALVRVLERHVASPSTKPDRDTVQSLAILRGRDVPPAVNPTPITPEQLNAFLATAGHTRETLFQNARTIIKNTAEKGADIKALLKDLREACDVELTIEQMALDPLFAEREMKLQVRHINAWENPRLAYPTGAQAREVAERVDAKLKDNQLSGLPKHDMDKIERIAQAAHKKWEKLPVTKKYAAAKVGPRSLITSWRESVTRSDTAAALG